MSPEQASGRTVDFRSDQFSVGLLLYEMATGRRAFERPTPVETLTAIIREEPEPLAVAAPRLAAPVRWVIERCLAKDPEERYASTRDLAREWQQLERNADVLATDTSLQTAQTARFEAGATARTRAGAGPSVALGARVPAAARRRPNPPRAASGASFSSRSARSRSSRRAAGSATG